jgi:putative nucleotidyltransferase with HDIG domain
MITFTCVKTVKRNTVTTDYSIERLRSGTSMSDLPTIQNLREENADLLRELEEIYTFLDTLLVSSHNEKEIIYRELRDGMSKYKRLTIGIMKSLTAAIDAKDRYTMGHSARVSTYTKMLCRELGYRGESLEYMEYAAILHDIGKIGISERILSKRGTLTREEINAIRRHPYLSTKIIESIDSFQNICPVILHHHEMYNGCGYPDGLKGEQIPPGSRILSLADSLDAMTTDRPYRKALDFGDSIKEIQRCTAQQFDPYLVETFLKMVRENRFHLTEKSSSKVSIP